jgi:Rrf2 family protein
MLFSTKAEYGVRLMVELGRQPGSAPVSLSAVAEAERLPLSYLEHLVAKLRNAELVSSTRGAHGGYRLARPAETITLDEVVEALEGQIAPMECFHETPEGKVLCSHENDGDRACATKLLWTRVQGGVTKALAGTTLAELVEFSGPERTPAGGARQRRLTHRKPRNGVKLAELEIRNLHVTAEDKEILKGFDLDVEKGKVHALMGPNGSGKSTLANAIMGHPALEVTEGSIVFKGEDITEADPDERSQAGLFMAFQYPVAIPGVSVSKYLRMIINAQREARGEEQIKIKDFAKLAQEAMALANIPKDFSSRYLNDGFSAARRSAWSCCSWRCCARDRGPRRDRLRPRHRRPAVGRRGRQQVRRPRHGRPDHHPLPAHPAHGEARTSSTSCSRADRQGGRPGAGRRARGEGLRLDPRGGRGGRLA